MFETIIFLLAGYGVGQILAEIYLYIKHRGKNDK